MPMTAGSSGLSSRTQWEERVALMSKTRAEGLRDLAEWNYGTALYSLSLKRRIIDDFGVAMSEAISKTQPEASGKATEQIFEQPGEISEKTFEQSPETTEPREIPQTIVASQSADSSLPVVEPAVALADPIDEKITELSSPVSDMMVRTYNLASQLFFDLFTGTSRYFIVQKQESSHRISN